ncbi:Hypothetical Protein FCC1311_022722 [Hondaea fermentalgiana]|uniref:Uncharacterized protein n=1 Tax=Hondaea fermentalgiana TaxID=2315210 RepID=A0A2R5G4U9_9STRA|nr:Hypothetical Protein FCC1311_022722 [Hondaea fermentalgiana]|eukprot:GBG26052.1 Hypothetical Protein FCC1311_022722 [Hondaea fermentalgiana]
MKRQRERDQADDDANAARRMSQAHAGTLDAAAQAQVEQYRALLALIDRSAPNAQTTQTSAPQVNSFAQLAHLQSQNGNAGQNANYSAMTSGVPAPSHGIRGGPQTIDFAEELRRQQLQVQLQQHYHLQQQLQKQYASPQRAPSVVKLENPRHDIQQQQQQQQQRQQQLETQLTQHPEHALQYSALLHHIQQTQNQQQQQQQQQETVHFSLPGVATPFINAVTGEFTSDFSKRYQRNNKRGGLKNLRCFPKCSETHKDRGFCGGSVHAKLETRFAPNILREVVCLARFARSASISLSMANSPDASLEDAAQGTSTPVPFGSDLVRPGDIISASRLNELRRTRVDRTKPWIVGDLAQAPQTEIKAGETIHSASFEFNRMRWGWHYGWVSNKHACDSEHAGDNDAAAAAAATTQQQGLKKEHQPAISADDDDDDDDDNDDNNDNAHARSSTAMPQ